MPPPILFRSSCRVTLANIALTVGAPTTISVQVNPATQIANSGQAADITATVTDLYGNPVSGVSLSGSTLPSTLGTVSALGATNASGQAFGTWTAGTASALARCA